MLHPREGYSEGVSRTGSTMSTEHHNQEQYGLLWFLLLRMFTPAVPFGVQAAISHFSLSLSVYAGATDAPVAAAAAVGKSAKDREPEDR